MVTDETFGSRINDKNSRPYYPGPGACDAGSSLRRRSDSHGSPSDNDAGSDGSG